MDDTFPFRHGRLLPDTAQNLQLKILNEICFSNISIEKQTSHLKALQQPDFFYLHSSILS